MSKKESKKEGSQQKQGLCSSIIIKNINDLNNDCLIHIFELLSIEDKLRIELVCARWKSVGKLSWSKVNILDIDLNYTSIKNCYNNDKISNFFTNVLARCGHYVNELYITDSVIHIKEVRSDILKFCKKLQKIRLYNLHGKITYDDNDLKLLFKNIRSIYFLNINMNGDCLNNLPAEQLEELEIYNCNFTSEKYFYDLLSKIKNLKKLGIHSHFIDSTRIFNALNQSDCTSICDLSIFNNQSFRDNFNKEFFKKQINLRKVPLQNLSITQEIIENLSKNSIEEILFVECNRDLISSLYKFSNLHTIVLYFKLNNFKKLTAKCVKIISEAIDVKFIRFSKSLCFISKDRNNFFKYLKKVMEEDGIEINIDKLLDFIKPCKNLESLNIGDCNFTGLGATYIGKFVNLKNLNISLNDKIADEWLILIIKKLTKLEKLFIFYCPLITNNSIVQANEIKKKRKDLHKLEVFCYGTNITKKDFPNTDFILLNDTSENLKI